MTRVYDPIMNSTFFVTLLNIESNWLVLLLMNIKVIHKLQITWSEISSIHVTLIKRVVPFSDSNRVIPWEVLYFILGVILILKTSVPFSRWICLVSSECRCICQWTFLVPQYIYVKYCISWCHVFSAYIPVHSSYYLASCIAHILSEFW